MDQHSLLEQSLPIGVLLGDSGNAFWHEMRYEYERQAAKSGLRVECAFADPEKDPNAQLFELERMVGSGFAALVVNPITESNLAPGILLAARRGLPVIDVGAKTNPLAVEEAGELYVPVRTVDFRAQGRLGAEFIVESLAALGGGHVAIVKGRANSRQSVERSTGAAEVFAMSAGIVLAGEASGDFDREKTRVAVRELWRASPSLNAVFFANDLMALSAAELFDTCDYRPLLVGVDGVPEARRAIAESRIDATVAFSPRDVARVILSVVCDLFEGGQPPSGYTVKSRLFTRRTALFEELSEAIVEFDQDRARRSAVAALDAGIDAHEIVELGLMIGMDRVGRLYQEHEYFVPELLLSSDAMYAALDVLGPHLCTGATATDRRTVVIGVVEGDTHDIGKNLVKAVLEASGFKVVDLGRDVPCGHFVEAARLHQADVIAMSALMTTTMDGMRTVIQELRDLGVRDHYRVIVGGAAVSAEFAERIGADAYVPVARGAAEDIRRLFEKATGLQRDS